MLRAICKDYSVKYVHSSIQDLASLMQILTAKTAYKFVFDAKSFLKCLISLNPDLDLSGEKIIISTYPEKCSKNNGKITDQNWFGTT